MASHLSSLRPPPHQDWRPAIASAMTPRPGAEVPLQRAGQPEEIAPSYVFLASDDASYMVRQVLRPSGGEVING
jgi:NAD(P)-dependent dehydrogenase (short-subunit alcohol dehydrogenase family)